MKTLFRTTLIALLVLGSTVATAQNSKSDKNIVQTALGNDNFSTLVEAVKAAGLAEALQGDGPFTVFAPENAAFEKVPQSKLKELMKKENRAKLVSLLRYHVVVGNITAEKLQRKIKMNDGKYEFSTIAGGKLTAMMQDGQVMIKDGRGNTSTIKNADVTATNGVIHVIDSVLMPAQNGEDKM